MKIIPLTQDRVALVDDGDYESLARFEWRAAHGRNTFYARRKVCSPDGRWEPIYMHREILGLRRGDSREADHKDGNGLNNTRANLRIATRAQNAHNGKMRVSNRSNFRGVSWDKKMRKWVAQIRLNGQKKCLGYHDTPEAAASIYDAAAVEHFGQFARPNFR